MLGRTWTDQIGGRVWLRASEPLMLRGPGSESVGSSRSARRLAGEERRQAVCRVPRALAFAKAVFSWGI